jgi:hypothetical protein
MFYSRGKTDGGAGKRKPTPITTELIPVLIVCDDIALETAVHTRDRADRIKRKWGQDAGRENNNNTFTWSGPSGDSTAPR